MNLKEEFDEGEKFVRDEWSLQGQRKGNDVFSNFFETTIRSLGGLIAAYDLSKRDIFLRRAKDLGERLIRAFDSTSGLPTPLVDLVTGRTRWSYHYQSIADIGTNQLEFRALAERTGKEFFSKISMRAFDEIVTAAEQLDTGVIPNMFRGEKEDVHSTRFPGSAVSMGGSGDSYYEYLIKLYVQSRGGDERYRKMFIKAMNAMIKTLLGKTRKGTFFIGTSQKGMLSDVQGFMEHLVCFVPGTLMLGANTLEISSDFGVAERKKWVEVAEAITETCYKMYKLAPSGLAPEKVEFEVEGSISSDKADMVIPADSARNLLRPETVESLYFMWYYTGNPKYRQYATEIFEAFKKHSKAAFGYSAVVDVRNVPTMHANSQETFFLAETLKYLFLIFSPRDTVNLDEFVFNTEAHPLRYSDGSGKRVVSPNEQDEKAAAAGQVAQPRKDCPVAKCAAPKPGCRMAVGAERTFTDDGCPVLCQVVCDKEATASAAAANAGGTAVKERIKTSAPVPSSVKATPAPLAPTASESASVAMPIPAIGADGGGKGYEYWSRALDEDL